MNGSNLSFDDDLNQLFSEFDFDIVIEFLQDPDEESEGVVESGFGTEFSGFLDDFVLERDCCFVFCISEFVFHFFHEFGCLFIVGLVVVILDVAVLAD